MFLKDMRIALKSKVQCKSNVHESWAVKSVNTSDQRKYIIFFIIIHLNFVLANFILFQEIYYYKVGIIIFPF